VGELSWFRRVISRAAIQPLRKTVAVGVLALVCVGAAHAAGWRVVKSGSSSGQFAIKSISATVSRPLALAVRLRGRVDTGTAIVSCSKDFGVGSWSRSYSHSGTFRLPQTRAADSCDVVASVGGSGRVVVQILAYR
jgi:hypothetical protein